MWVKKWIGIVAVLMFLLLWEAIAAAEVSGINVMSVHAVEDAPVMYFEVRALDSTGTGVRTQEQDFHFRAGEEGVELAAEIVPSDSQGHIIVVDTSLYYYGSKNIKSENIRDIVSAYLSRLSGNERIMFVLATNANTPTCTNYMDLGQAKEFVQGIELGKEKSAKINTAIYAAFQYAISPAQEAPMFNSVFIVADPDLETNQDSERSLNECAMLRASSGRYFDVAVAVVNRESYLKDTSEYRSKAIRDGFAKFESFALQCGGEYLQIPQNNQGVDTEDLHVRLSKWLYTTNCFKVDFSALSGHVSTDTQMQNVNVSVACSYNGGNTARSVEVLLNTDLLPPPEITPEPTAEEPILTPTPAPTPVVSVGQTDATAMQAIYSLQQMNYLSVSNVKEFDNNCFIAYIDFCKNNGIDPRDGIYEDTYALLMSGNAVAAAVVTPEPTATPEPTIPPDGYAINDQDTEDSGGFIAQMQAILKNLNCYEDEASANVGRLDQATVDAVNRYCEAFNWRNDHVNGVSKTICTEILTNGSKLNPLVPPELTIQEKAKAFFTATTSILQYDVPNWMLAIACFVLLIVIAVICILLKPGKSKDSSISEDEQPTFERVISPTPSNPAGHLDEDEPTSNPYSSKYVQLEIDFGGRCQKKEITLTEGKQYSIGRKDSRSDMPDPNLILDSEDKSVSRGKHAVMTYKNGQIYIRDESSYHNTTVNNMTIYDREGRDGLIIDNGDEIAIGNHKIKVKW